jgi:hypothetical protein
MGSLTALVVAAPLFGLSLSPPDVEAPRSLVPGAAQAAALAATEEAAAEEAVASDSDLMRRLHMGFGIATWAAMTATVVLGAFQYSDEYGLFVPFDETPCERGDAVFGQWQCATPVLHLSLAALTAALYATTFTLSYFVRPRGVEPDRSSRHGRRLRDHRLLRWIHLAGMAGQIVGGVVVANLGAMGVDPEENHRVFQGIATWHLAVGLITWAALTWAGALMLF